MTPLPLQERQTRRSCQATPSSSCLLLVLFPFLIPIPIPVPVAIPIPILTLAISLRCICGLCQRVHGVEELLRLTPEQPGLRQECYHALRNPFRLRRPDN